MNTNTMTMEQTMEQGMELKIAHMESKVAFLKTMMDRHISALAKLPWTTFIKEFGEEAVCGEVMIKDLEDILRQCKATPTLAVFESCKKFILSKATSHLSTSSNPISNTIDLWTNNAHKELYNFLSCI